jgi:hypothetical protein
LTPTAASDSSDSRAVASARRLFRLGLALAAVSVGALATATALALTSVDFRIPDPDAVAAACRAALSPFVSWPALAVAMLGAISLATLFLGARSLVRQGLDGGRYVSRLRMVEPLAIDGMRVILIEDDRPQAFCAGLLRPRVYVSTGALIALDDDELRAVLAHERHHQRRRDPLRLLLVRAIGDALFFMPVLRRLRQRYAILAELAADDAAVAAAGSRSALASALLTFGERPNSQVIVGIAPERVDHLLGERARWELPMSLFAGAIVTLGGLVAIGAAAASQSGATGMSLPFVLAQLCTVAMTAFPAIVGAGLLVASTRRLRRADTGAASPLR